MSGPCRRPAQEGTRGNDGEVGQSCRGRASCCSQCLGTPYRHTESETTWDRRRHADAFPFLQLPGMKRANVPVALTVPVTQRGLSSCRHCTGAHNTNANCLLGYDAVKSSESGNFEGKYHLHSQGRTESQARNRIKQTVSRFVLAPRRWKPCVPPHGTARHRTAPPADSHGITWRPSLGETTLRLHKCGEFKSI